MGTGQKVQRTVKVAVYVGFEFGPPQITVQGQQIRTQIRDVQGNVAAPECLILRRTGMGVNPVLVLDELPGDEGIFAAQINNLNPNNFTWRMFALRRGYVLFDKPVQIQAN